MNSIVKELNNIENYTFPFEGEKHLATIVVIPYHLEDEKEKISPLLNTYIEIVRQISRFEPVVVIADPAIDYKIVSKFQFERVHVLRLHYESACARNILPLFLKNDADKRLCGIDFKNVDDTNEYDEKLAKELLLELRIHRHNETDFSFQNDFVITDGKETVLLSENLLQLPCFSSLSKDAIEQSLSALLHAKKILWLPKAITNDNRFGYVTNDCYFLKPDVIALNTIEDESDTDYSKYVENLTYLQKATNAIDAPYTIVSLPRPAVDQKTCFSKESYLNIYMGEKFVLLPQFQVEQDKVAMDILSSIYQGEKEIIPIDCTPLLMQKLSLRELALQIPYMDGYPIFPDDKDK